MVLLLSAPLVTLIVPEHVNTGFCILNFWQTASNFCNTATLYTYGFRGASSHLMVALFGFTTTRTALYRIAQVITVTAISDTKNTIPLILTGSLFMFHYQFKAFFYRMSGSLLKS